MNQTVIVVWLGLLTVLQVLVLVTLSIFYRIHKINAKMWQIELERRGALEPDHK